MHSEVVIPVDGVTLPGDLDVPEGAVGIVVFVHGAGSSRLSERNRAVAKELRSTGRLATLLFDLLTEAEDEEYENRFDIGMLTERLLAVTRWAQAEPSTSDLVVGYFGASTGAAAALRASSGAGAVARSVVSRGGRPDLAGEALPSVRVPVLFIVGGADREVLALNEYARVRVSGPAKLEVIPGATHLFPEPGALDRVAQLTLQWFEETLVDSERTAPTAR